MENTKSQKWIFKVQNLKKWKKYSNTCTQKEIAFPQIKYFPSEILLFEDFSFVANLDVFKRL